MCHLCTGISQLDGGVPNGIRTRVLALKGPRPRPLDDGDPEGVRSDERPKHLMIAGRFDIRQMTA